MKIRMERKPKIRPVVICGICGVPIKRDEAIPDDGSKTGYICNDCNSIQHPEFEEFGEE